MQAIGYWKAAPTRSRQSVLTIGHVCISHEEGPARVRPVPDVEIIVPGDRNPMRAFRTTEGKIQTGSQRVGAKTGDFRLIRIQNINAFCQRTPARSSCRTDRDINPAKERTVWILVYGHA